MPATIVGSEDASVELERRRHLDRTASAVVVIPLEDRVSDHEASVLRLDRPASPRRGVGFVAPPLDQNAGIDGQDRTAAIVPVVLTKGGVPERDRRPDRVDRASVVPLGPVPFDHRVLEREIALVDVERTAVEGHDVVANDAVSEHRGGVPEIDRPAVAEEPIAIAGPLAKFESFYVHGRVAGDHEYGVVVAGRPDDRLFGARDASNRQILSFDPNGLVIVVRADDDDITV